MNLYINACVREGSRTDYLARKLLGTLGDYVELHLEDLPLQPLRRDSLNARTERVANEDFSNPTFDYAKQFRDADNIIIAAPFWDLSFPALLKIYLENIYVTGLVSRYGNDGTPVGLCKGNTLYYVTTAGGPYDSRFSYDYLKELAINYFGIRHTQLISAEMLDVQGFDPEQILTDCLKKHHLI